jgi:hypothetical protein
MNKKRKKNAACKSHSKSKYIDEGKNFILTNLPQCQFIKITAHFCFIEKLL